MGQDRRLDLVNNFAIWLLCTLFLCTHHQSVAHAVYLYYAFTGRAACIDETQPRPTPPLVPL